MIKNFKKDSYKIWIKGIVGCVLAGAVILTNSVNVKALDINNTTLTTNIMNISKFLVDTPTKTYDNIGRVEKVAGFEFKLPDFPRSNKAESLQLIKLSDKDNVLLIYLDGDINFTFQVSEKEPLEYLKKIGNIKNGLSNLKVESEEQAMKLGEIDGFSVIVTSISPAETLKSGDVRPEFKEVNKYFAWKNEGLWYSIGYNSTVISSTQNNTQSHNISQDDLEKIAKSIVYPEEIKNVNYSVEKEASTEIATMMIYEKEDLEKAKSFLGFNPKFPLKINEDISIKESSVGISGDSDIKNNNINYELTSFYSNKSGSITFTEKKNLKYYEDILKNGYINIWDNENEKNKQVKGEKININNNEVWKYLYTEKLDDGTSINNGEYIWKENNIYYSVCFFEDTDNSDEIIKEFVDSKTVD
ncbi:peptidase M56, BlaR1 [Clostridium chromiireducens]|uniref:Peptidase M56, BlaR1 n=1 Tax=Clostridium chromiireducens TaxID=225345 RepID=A0A964RSJ5_9CLOT|nr:peptidase M56, BlaR1 [Clostridium chromiireducens]MVX67069.1 peptidase M56, BlaR1 [Clostridium chromiireducens]